jgi:hypothetical protein
LFGVSAPWLIILLPVVLLVLVYSLVTGKSVSMTFANKTFSFGGQTQAPKQTKTTPPQHIDQTEYDDCSSCSKKELYVERAKAIVQECTNHTNDLKRNIILQQMNFAEEKVGELRILICKNYSKNLATKLGVGVITAKEHKDYKFYRLVIYHILLQKVKDGIIKKALKENHFLDMSNVEFEHYKNRKTEMIIETISDGLDSFYSDDTIIKREELFSINENIKRETVSIIMSIFDNARNISATYNHKINECMKEANDKLEEV